MLTRYIVTYDICDDKRLKKVFKEMRNFGDHLQYSVFDCVLSEKDLVVMRDKLRKLIDASEDQVLIIRLGPSDGTAVHAIDSLGVPHQPPERLVTVL